MLRFIPSIHSRPRIPVEPVGFAVPATRLDAAGMAMIARFESFRAYPYLDLGGKATIGFGHVLRADEVAHLKRGISRDLAWSLLRKDGGIAEQALRELVTVPLNQNQFNALASFVFNVGRGAFAGSALLKQLNLGNYHEVPAELLRWVHVDGKSVLGLKNRRRSEAELFNRPPNGSFGLAPRWPAR